MPEHTELKLYQAITNCVLYMDKKALMEDTAVWLEMLILSVKSLF